MNNCVYCGERENLKEVTFKSAIEEFKEMVCQDEKCMEEYKEDK